MNNYETFLKTLADEIAAKSLQIADLTQLLKNAEETSARLAEENNSLREELQKYENPPLLTEENTDE